MKEAYAKIVSALFSKTGKDTQMVFFGQVLTSGVGFVLNIVLLRTMSTNDYGLFSLFFSLMMLASGFMHLGWSETFVRFGAKYFSSPKFEAIRFAVFLKILRAACLIAFAGFLGDRILATRLYERGDFTPYVMLAMVGAVFLTLFSFIQNELRTRGSFKIYFYFNLGTSIARLAVISVLAAWGSVLLSHVIGVYIWVLVGVVVPYLLVVKGYRPSRKTLVDPETMREMRAFNSWSLVSLVAVNIIGNIDSSFLAHYHDNATLSAFGAASRLTLPISLVISSVTATLLPRLSAAKNDGDYRLYLDRIKLFLIPAALLTLAMVWIAPPLLIALAGSKYVGIETLIRLQILAMLVVLLANPVSLVLTAWGMSAFFATMNVVQLFVDLYLDWAWIPRWGASGAVAATLAVNLIGMVCIYVRLFYGLRARRT